VLENEKSEFSYLGTDKKKVPKSQGYLGDWEETG
jgi:hypothetical protein